MCCGRSRTAISQTRTPSYASSGTASSAPAATRAASYVAYFEYVGGTGMTVLGPSGARYRFQTRGSRLAVDLRDRAAVAAVPGMVQVRSL